MMDTMLIYARHYARNARDCAKEKWDSFCSEEWGGAEILATIVLVAIVILLAVAFRSQLNSMVNNIWSAISGKTSEITSDFETVAP